MNLDPSRGRVTIERSATIVAAFGLTSALALATSPNAEAVDHSAAYQHVAQQLGNLINHAVNHGVGDTSSESMPIRKLPHGQVREELKGDFKNGKGSFDLTAVGTQEGHKLTDITSVGIVTDRTVKKTDSAGKTHSHDLQYNFHIKKDDCGCWNIKISEETQKANSNQPQPGSTDPNFPAVAKGVRKETKAIVEHGHVLAYLPKLK